MYIWTEQANCTVYYNILKTQHICNDVVNTHDAEWIQSLKLNNHEDRGDANIGKSSYNEDVQIKYSFDLFR